MWSWLAELFAPPRPPIAVEPEPAVVVKAAPAPAVVVKAAPAPAPVPVVVVAAPAAAPAPSKGYLGKASIVALACTVIGGFEGLRQSAYPDPATDGAPWTICYGHTGHVTQGEKDSLAQCKALLTQDLGTAASGLEACIKVPMTDARTVAYLSLAYNVGVSAICKSTPVRELNAGNLQAACDGFLLYNRAAGIVMPGLTSRRQKERALCLEQ